MEEQVVLVDRRDREQGSAEKMSAHREGRLHRAFSVFIFNPRGELLLQRRAAGKYHSAGLWSNACCGHPRPGEDLLAAARQRLREEMGFETDIHQIGHFIYREPVGAGLWEHEYDHVLTGEYGGNPVPNPVEVMEWKWWSLGTVRERLEENPEGFTVWFSPALEVFLRTRPKDR